MIEIIDNEWRPFVKLTAIDNDGNEAPFYFDVNARVAMIQEDGKTVLNIKDLGAFYVKETPTEIIEAADRMVKEQKEKIYQENFERTQEAIEKFANKENK
jgi:hypothetical protein